MGVFFLLLPSCSGNAVNNFVRCPVHRRGFFPLNDTDSGNLSHQTGDMVTEGPPEQVNHHQKNVKSAEDLEVLGKDENGYLRSQVV